MAKKKKRFLDLPKAEAADILKKAGIDYVRLNELYHKQGIVNKLSSVMSRGAEYSVSAIGSCSGCELRVYLIPKGDSYSVQEMLVIHYRGGAYAARNATHNSNSANFQEIGRLLNGGYYEENEALEGLETSAFRLSTGDHGRYWVYRPATEVEEE